MPDRSYIQTRPARTRALRLLLVASAVGGSFLLQGCEPLFGEGNSKPRTPPITPKPTSTSTPAPASSQPAR